MSDGFKQIILDQELAFLASNKRQFTAGRMPNLERSLVEVSGTRPEAIGAGPIARSIDPMTPDTLGEIDPLSCFDHIGRRFGSQFPFLNPQESYLRQSLPFQRFLKSERLRRPTARINLGFRVTLTEFSLFSSSRKSRLKSG